MKTNRHTQPSRLAGLLFAPALLLYLPAAAQAADLVSLLKQPASQNGFLSPDQAFQLTVQARSSHQLIASFRPAPGYYVYRDRIRLGLLGAGDARIVRTRMPPAVIKTDPYFGRMAVYPRPFQVIIDLERSARANGAVDLSADYQGCSERGLCYQPAHKVIRAPLPAGR